MAIYKPSELKEFLNSLGIFPKKGLSQNFLIDGNIIKKIVSSAKVCPSDVVLEIGPGPGALTEELLHTGATVIAVEKDPVLAKALERLQTPDRRLYVYCEDILQFSISEIASLFCKKGDKIKVIGNLPYHLTTPILIYLTEKHDLFSTLTIMVQDEVGRRFTAAPGNKEYGSITVYLNFYTTPSYAFTVSRQCFYPAPKVDSSIIVLEFKSPPDLTDYDGFFRLTRTAFEHRRKMLRASLRELYSPEKITQALFALGLNPLARPEELSLDHFLSLFIALNEK